MAKFLTVQQLLRGLGLTASLSAAAPACVDTHSTDNSTDTARDGYVGTENPIWVPPVRPDAGDTKETGDAKDGGDMKDPPDVAPDTAMDRFYGSDNPVWVPDARDAGDANDTRDTGDADARDVGSVSDLAKE